MRWLKSLFSLNPVSLTLGTICVVVGLFVCGIPLLDLIELKTYDLRFVPRGHVSPSPAVVIAGVDEKSLNAEGRWPWPRSKLAALVDILSQDENRGRTRIFGVNKVHDFGPSLVGNDSDYYQEVCDAQAPALLPPSEKSGSD